MRDSGVQWLGEIPAHWDIKPVNALTMATDKYDPSQDPDTEFRYIDVSSISSELHQIAAFEQLKGYDAPTRARNVVFEGDTIFATVRPYLRNIALIPIELHDSICSTGYCVLRPKRITLESRYLFYSCISAGFVASVVEHQEGVSYPAVSDRVVRRQDIPLPPLHEQRAIAAYLDRETAKIDSLIGETEALNALLREKRVALISQAVTKGLDADVEMKDSDVEWLGEIPAHWDVWKLSHAYKQIASGTTPNTTELSYFDGTVNWVTTSELRENTITSTKTSLSDRALREHSTLKVYPPGTLLIAMYGATIGRLGILGIPASTNQACCALAGSDVLETRFAFYSLLVSRDHVIQLSFGGGQPNINQQTIRGLSMPVPPLHEQRAIAAHLDRETAKIDALVAKKDELIALLREKRTALISAAVTGKIAIPHLDDKKSLPHFGGGI